jgi:hypothetical protein
MAQANPLEVSASVAKESEKAATSLSSSSGQAKQHQLKEWTKTSKATEVYLAKASLPHPVIENLGFMRPKHISIYYENGDPLLIVREASGTEAGAVEVSGGRWSVNFTVIRQFLRHEKFGPFYRAFLKKHLSEAGFARVAGTNQEKGTRSSASGADAMGAKHDGAKTKIAAAVENAAAAAQSIKRVDSKTAGSGNSACSLPFGKLTEGDYHTATSDLGTILTSQFLEFYLRPIPPTVFVDCDENDVRDLLNAEYSKQRAESPDVVPRIGQPPVSKRIKQELCSGKLPTVGGGRGGSPTSSASPAAARARAVGSS